MDALEYKKPGIKPLIKINADMVALPEIEVKPSGSADNY